MHRLPGLQKGSLQLPQPRTSLPCPGSCSQSYIVTPPTPQGSILLAGHNSQAICCWSRARTGVSEWSQGAEQGQGSVGGARMNGGVKGRISQLRSQACEREITLPKTPKSQKTNEATMTLRKPQGEATAGSHMGRYVQLRGLPEA